MLTSTQEGLLKALSNALNGRPVGELTEDVIQEARQQAVLSLISSGTEAKTVFANNYRLLWEQQQLERVLGGISYVVLKGSAAAIYYPEPLRRTLGDIDILVTPGDYEKAKQALEANGYARGSEDDRHIHYLKNNATIELHERFATLQTQTLENFFDEWLYRDTLIKGSVSKFTFPMLSSGLNGLTLLTHINQHLEEGLGLRQLIDWMMYVNLDLPDSKWPAFKEKTDQLGLTKIAEVTAKLGQKYLKLYPNTAWFINVSDHTVDDLLDYAFECGNFGSKDSSNNTIIMVMSHGRGVKGFFKNLQQQGLANWGLLKRTPWLKPVAWIYQLCRYVKRGLKGGGLRHFSQNIAASKRRNKLMDELGATRLALK